MESAAYNGCAVEESWTVHFHTGLTYTPPNSTKHSMVHWPTRSPFRFSFTRFQEGILKRKFYRAGLRKEQVTLENGSISCWVGGEGPPLLLLQGFGASAIWQFHPQVRALAKKRRLVVPDLLYFGGSSSPNGHRSVSFQAETMFQLMDALDIPQFEVMSLSYGGFVALWMISLDAERVGRLIISNSPGLGMDEGDYQGLLDAFEVAHPRDVFLPTQPSGIRRLMAIAWHRPPPLPGFALRDAFRNLYQDQMNEKRELLDELVGHLGTSVLDATTYDHVSGPVLIIWGEHDRVFPIHLAHRLKRDLNPKARLEILKRTAHAPNLERPRAYNRMVLRFLAE